MKKPEIHIATVYPEHCGCTTGIQHTNQKDITCPECKANLKNTPILLKFPLLKAANENGILRQLDKIDEEHNEIRKAFLLPDINCTAEEVMDKITALVTLLRIIERDHGINPVGVNEAVNIKNRMRGYEVEFHREATNAN